VGADFMPTHSEGVRASALLPVFVASVLHDGEGHDGGLVNNLPTDVGRARTGGPVLPVGLAQPPASAVRASAALMTIQIMRVRRIPWP